MHNAPRMLTTRGKTSVVDDMRPVYLRERLGRASVGAISILPLFYSPPQHSSPLVLHVALFPFPGPCGRVRCICATMYLSARYKRVFVLTKVARYPARPEECLSRCPTGFGLRRTPRPSRLFFMFCVAAALFHPSLIPSTCLLLSSHVASVQSPLSMLRPVFSPMKGRARLGRICSSSRSFILFLTPR